MNILHTLTIRNLKLNKKRTIVTIIGIVLSVALICAVAGMFQSLHKTIVDDTIRYQGKWHVSFSDIETKDLDIFKNHKDINEYYLITEAGDAHMKELGIEYNMYTPYLKIIGYDKTALELYPLRLDKGDLPTSEKEILVPNNLGYKIGDKITLTVGIRSDLDGNRLTIYDSLEYWDEEKSENVMKDYLTEEQLLNSIEKEYTVVGLTDSNYGPYYSEVVGATFITYISEPPEDAYSTVYVLYNNPKKYETISDAIGRELYSDAGYQTYSTNSMYLELIGASFSDNTNKALITVAAIIIGIIMLSSIFVIKNGFSISVVERYRQFGMLSSQGATPKQIRKMVLFEGLIVGTISIFLGILVGILAVFILINIINILMADFFDFHFSYQISWLVIAASIVMGGITIFLSCLMPAVKIAKVSPIDAIRNSNEIKMKAKKLRTPKYISKLVGIGGEIAHKNLKRSKKKYRTTVVSLVVSIVIFIAISSFIQVIARSSSYYFNDKIDFDIIVSAYGNNETKEDILKTYEEIAKLGYIDRYSIARTNYLSMEDMSLLNTDYYNECFDNDYCLGIGVNVIAVGEEEFAYYVNQLGGDVDDYKTGAILLDEVLVLIRDTEKYKEVTLLNIKVGDTIKLTENLYYEDDEQMLNDDISHEIKILKRTSEVPLSIWDLDPEYPTPILIVSDEYFDSLFGENYNIDSMYIKSNELSDFKIQLDNYIENQDGSIEIYYTDVAEAIKAIRTMMLLVQIFLYGFIGVISLIGVTNIFNTITTNMALRSREFAMLKSVGMTGKEFNRMIRLESILYGLKSLVIGIPIGIVLSKLIYNGMSATIILRYELPFMAIILSIIFVFTIVYITMKYSLNKINKQNIIETIRQENL